MISKDQFVKGLLNYAENDVIPHLSTTSKFAFGTILILAADKINEIADSLMDNSMIKALGIMCDNGMVDDDRLIMAMKQSADRYGNIEIKIPLIDKMTFNSHDIDRLHSYLG